MHNAERSGGPVAAAQKCATHGPLSVATRGRRCTAWELYAAVRLAVVDEGLSHHEAGRRFGIDRRTVKKMLSYSAPPGYRRTKPVRRPKLDGFTGIVDALLEADTDPDVPRKQRHTALESLDHYMERGGTTIVRAAFEHSYFVHPDKVRQKTCPFHLFHRASQRRLGSPSRTSF